MVGEATIVGKYSVIADFYVSCKQKQTIRTKHACLPSQWGITGLSGPRQANLCLRAFRHDKFQMRMSSHSEGPGIWLSV